MIFQPQTSLLLFQTVTRCAPLQWNNIDIPWDLESVITLRFNVKAKHFTWGHFTTWAATVTFDTLSVTTTTSVSDSCHSSMTCDSCSTMSTSVRLMTCSTCVKILANVMCHYCYAGRNISPGITSYATWLAWLAHWRHFLVFGFVRKSRYDLSTK